MAKSLILKGSEGIAHDVMHAPHNAMQKRYAFGISRDPQQIGLSTL